MKPTIGFLRPRLASSLMNCAASSSAEQPNSRTAEQPNSRTADFADHDDQGDLVVGQDYFEDVDELGALDRIAADIDHGWSTSEARPNATIVGFALGNGKLMLDSSGAR
jgi:hypothetical protein